MANVLKITVSTANADVSQKVAKACESKAVGTFAASELARLMRPYIPERDSILIKSYRIKPFEVIYNTPYAKAMFEGVVKGRKVKYRKPTARSHWEKGVNKSDFARTIGEYIGKVL